MEVLFKAKISIFVHFFVASLRNIVGILSNLRFLQVICPNCQLGPRRVHMNLLLDRLRYSLGKDAFDVQIALISFVNCQVTAASLHFFKNFLIQIILVLKQVLVSTFLVDKVKRHF